MNNKQLHLNEKGNQFFLFPSSLSLKKGVFTLVNLVGETKKVDEKSVFPYKISKKEAIQHFKEKSLQYKNIVLERFANFTTTETPDSSWSVFASLFKLEPPYSIDQLQQAIKSSFDSLDISTESDANSIAELIHSFSQMLSKETQNTLQTDSLKKAVEGENPTELAALMAKYAEIIRSSPYKIQDTLINTFFQFNPLATQLKKQSPKNLRNFNLRFAKTLTEFSKKIKNPAESSDLDTLVKDFEEKVYSLMKMEHPDKKKGREQYQKMKKEAEESIRISLNKSGLKSFSDFRKD